MCTYVANRGPSVKVGTVVHIDADLRETSKHMREASAAFLKKKEFVASVSLVRTENKTFLETRYSRFYPSELVNETAYDQLKILAKPQEPDHNKTRRAYISFINMSDVGDGPSETEEATTDDEMYLTPPIKSWSVKIYNSRLSTDEYTPLSLSVRGFKLTLSYIQDCSDIPKTCEDVESALME